MSFQQGLSGLNAAARNLDVIGNNIANSNTIGSKTSRVEFASVYATSLEGAGTSFNGIGVSVAAVAQQFTQGDIATSDNELDLAINGSGFFRITKPGSKDEDATFTRNGQFHLDKDGYVVNAQGGQLTGYAADEYGELLTGRTVPLRLDVGDASPKATTSGNLTVNLNAQAKVPDDPFSVANGGTYNGATSINVYDSQGGEHTVAVYFRKADANEWEAYVSVDGTPPVGPTTLTFDGTGKMSGAVTSLTAQVPASDPAEPPIDVEFNLAKSTQFGSLFSVSELTQDGYAAGRLAGFSVASDGTVLARYTNGQVIAKGQVVLANFTNPQGLRPIGDNQWMQTAESGSPLIGAPGAGTLGVIQSGAVEQSNVDLTAELVNMITAQRVYQANAQAIRTHDQVMQAIVNLR